MANTRVSGESADCGSSASPPVFLLRLIRCYIFWIFAALVVQRISDETVLLHPADLATVHLPAAPQDRELLFAGSKIGGASLAAMTSSPGTSSPPQLVSAPSTGSNCEFRP
jgi:hypothetical protein